VCSAFRLLTVYVTMSTPNITLVNICMHKAEMVTYLWALQALKHAFTYHWKLWTIPEVSELLQEAGFAEVHIWMRCMIVSAAPPFLSTVKPDAHQQSSRFVCRLMHLKTIVPKVMSCVPVMSCVTCIYLIAFGAQLHALCTEL